VTRRGPTPKNRERLRQFRDREVITKLVGLSQKLLAVARRNPVKCRSVMLIQGAVAIAILTFAPVRIANLRSLDRTRHFVPSFSTSDRGMQLFVPAAEVKNSVDLQFPMPAVVMDLINIYMSEYQPLLCGESESGLLFPGRGGKPKYDTKLREQITRHANEGESRDKPLSPNSWPPLGGDGLFHVAVRSAGESDRRSGSGDGSRRPKSV
jgi:hypothetical protein